MSGGAARRLTATLFAVLLVGLATGGVGAATVAGAAPPRAELSDIEDEVMCPICGTALNLSQSPQADAERAFIRRRIAVGQTKEEIKQALIAEYGPRVVAQPSRSGFDLTAWLLPAVALALGAAGLLVAVRRWRRTATPGEPAAPLSGEAERRLEGDMSRYDL